MKDFIDACDVYPITTSNVESGYFLSKPIAGSVKPERDGMYLRYLPGIDVVGCTANTDECDLVYSWYCDNQWRSDGFLVSQIQDAAWRGFIGITDFQEDHS